MNGDGEGAKYWMRVLTEIKNRGVADVCIAGLRRPEGPPEAVAAVWPQPMVQTCIVHLLRNSFRYASRKDWAAIARDLKPVYTAASEARPGAFAEFAAAWETGTRRSSGCGRTRGRSSCRSWPSTPRSARSSATTNAIESLNARLRRAVRARGHFPTEQAALKCLYLAILSLDPTGKGRRRWTNRWKGALNAFDITFNGRLSAGRK